MLKSLRNIVAVCFSLSMLNFIAGFPTEAQYNRPILIVFHGAEQTREDMREIAKISYESKKFAQVLVIGYDWKTATIPDAAPKIFGSLSKKFQNSKFVLLGNKEGGLIAEWIATRVKAAEGKISRVITLNSPFEGKGNTEASLGTGLKNLEPNSDTIRALKSDPLNDISAVDFLRLWEKGNSDVLQESALRALSGEVTTSRFIIRTKPFNPREVFPEILAQAKKDFDSEQYSKVIEGCKYILKTEPKHLEANEYLGLSLFNSAVNESNASKAAETLGESLQPLVAAIKDGRGYGFPVAHHHSFEIAPTGIPTFNNVCYGRLHIYKDYIFFVPQEITINGHMFKVPPSRILDLQFIPSSVGTIHLEIDISGKKDKSVKKKVYNFFPSKTRTSTTLVPLASAGAIGFNKFDCNEGCPSISQTITRILNQVKEFSPPPTTISPTEENRIKVIHWAVRKKNKHIGVLTLSPTGLRWEETENNPDPKHNFSVSWADVEQFGFSPCAIAFVLQKKKGYIFLYEMENLACNEIGSVIDTVRLVRAYNPKLPVFEQ